RRPGRHGPAVEGNIGICRSPISRMRSFSLAAASLCADGRRRGGGRRADQAGRYRSRRTSAPRESRMCPFTPASTRPQHVPGRRISSLAKEIGVDEGTVRNARKDSAPGSAPDRHVGPQAKNYFFEKTKSGRKKSFGPAGAATIGPPESWRL